MRTSELVVPGAIVYSVSSRICHQRPERSFRIADIQMPVCARCSALYVSAAAGTLLAWRTRRSGIVRAAPRRLTLVLAALPTAITFGLEIAGWVRFSNSARAIAALPLGAYAGWLFVRMLRDGSLGYDSRLDAHKNPSR